GMAQEWEALASERASELAKARKRAQAQTGPAGRHWQSGGFRRARPLLYLVKSRWRQQLSGATGRSIPVPNFLIDSCNENLREARIHRNCALRSQLVARIDAREAGGNPVVA